jgi:hypothetical protein
MNFFLNNTFCNLHHSQGVDELSKALPNVKSYDIIPDFNHLDVMLGRDARILLYNRILERMKIYKI